MKVTDSRTGCQPFRQPVCAELTSLLLFALVVFLLARPLCLTRHTTTAVRVDLWAFLRQMVREVYVTMKGPLVGQA